MQLSGGENKGLLFALEASADLFDFPHTRCGLASPRGEEPPPRQLRPVVPAQSLPPRKRGAGTQEQPRRSFPLKRELIICT
jgi:hypothetical protein